ncbi:MAG: DUF4912 domain-containing protein [Spirochaetes bacterium]|nr:DUF4912 domain-containing protein [Spirochaetota bacterium]
MKRDFLEALSVEELCQAGRDLGIDIYSLIKKADIVELILENLESEEESNNLLINGEGLKYSPARGITEESLESIEYPIPERYDETKIMLMLRDPDWAFAYWDIETSLIAGLKSDVNFSSLILRVYDNNDRSFYFDIKVQFSDMGWYIKLPRRNSSYVIELGYISGERYTALAESNKIYTPGGSLASEKDLKWYSDTTERLIDLSQIGLLSPEKSENVISQRIISFSSSSYIQHKE